MHFRLLLLVPLILGPLLAAASQPATPTQPSAPMNAPTVTLGYVLLTVKSVPASLGFYEKAFGLKRRFLHEDGDKAYGELETGATRLGFVSLAQAESTLGCTPVTSTPNTPPLAMEIALVSQDVAGVYEQALKAGAKAHSAPTAKPWGQVVAYVRDPDGHLVELCSPMP